MSINSTLRQKQTYAHYSHVKGCKDQGHDSVKKGTDIDISEILVRLNNLETNVSSIQSSIELINTDITNIKNDVTNIKEDINSINNNIIEITSDFKDLSSRVTDIETNMSYSINPSMATCVIGSDNTFDSIVYELSTMDDNKLDDLYTETIRGMDTAEQANTLPEKLTLKPALQNKILKNDILDNEACSKKWDELTTEQKRAYIMQWYLADPSNQIRALYLLNEIVSKIIPSDIATVDGI